MSAARLALATAIEMRASKSAELRLEEPETLLGACGLLKNQLESSPEEVLRKNRKMLSQDDGKSPLAFAPPEEPENSQ